MGVGGWRGECGGEGRVGGNTNNNSNRYVYTYTYIYI